MIPNGLSQPEVDERIADGQSNVGADPPGRRVVDIVKANTLNSITVVLLTLGLALLVMGRARDGFINLAFIVAIVGVGSFQEIRAKRHLDRITILAAPTVTVRRDGANRSIGPVDVVLDDIVVVQSGDQVVADSVLITDSVIELDESLLTGESDPVRKGPGDDVHSGSYCVSGDALVRVTKVGRDSAAASLTETAQAYRPTKTPLQRLVDHVLQMLITVAAFFGLIFLAQGIVAQDSHGSTGRDRHGNGRGHPGWPLPDLRRDLLHECSSTVRC